MPAITRLARLLIALPCIAISMPALAQVPLPPSDCSAAHDCACVNITWRDNATNESGFELECSRSGSTWVRVAILPANTTSHCVRLDDLVPPLAPETQPCFRVRAYRTGSPTQFSAYSNFVCLWLLQSPVIDSVTPVSEQSLRVCWTDRSTHNSGLRLEKAIAGGTWSLVAILPRGSGCLTVNNLAPDTSSCFQIRAQATFANSCWSNFLCARTLGACCAPSGSCSITGRSACSGTFFASSCNPLPCIVPTGACCSVTGNCTTTTLASCGGTWLGANSTCTPNPCPGACCDLAGNCFVTPSTNCDPSMFRGAGSTCAPTTCAMPAMQACCNRLTLECRIENRNSYDCSHGSQWSGTSCVPLPCGGACCSPFGQCTIASAAGCPFAYQGDGTTCSPGRCPTLYACCAPNGSCTLTPQTECPFTSLSCQSSCTPHPCQTATACCDLATGVCFVSTPSACAAPEFRSACFAGTLCSPAGYCPGLQSGACCRGATCVTLNNVACAGPLSRFAGANTTCNVPGNSTAPCCVADFNQSTGPAEPTVDDLFQFLGAFFVSSPLADADRSGTTSLQDLFSFLAAYFSGCS
jgi:hypothetical protein